MFMLQGGVANSLGLFEVPYAKAFGWSRTEISLLFTAFAFSLAMTFPLTGWLLDWVDAGLVIAVGTISASGALLAATSAKSFQLMLVLYLLLGFGLGLSTMVPQVVVITNWFDRGRGLPLGIMMGVQAVGSVVLLPLVSYAIAAHGWQAGELALAVPALILVVPCVLLFVRTRPREAQASTEAIVTANESGELLVRRKVAEAVRSSSFWMLALAAFCYGYVCTTPLYHVVAYLIELRYRGATGALTLSLASGFATIGPPAMGILADRFSGRSALSLTFGVFAISSVVLLAAQQVLFLALFILTYGVVFSTVPNLLPIVQIESLGLEGFNRVLGFLNLLMACGGMVGPLVAGKIYDASLSYRPGFMLCIIVSLIGVAATLACAPLRLESAAAAQLAASQSR